MKTQIRLTRLRKEDRDERSRAVFYLENREETDYFRYFAYTVNVSDNGVCICTDRPIEKGEEFLLESPLWKDARPARAVWANQLGDALFEAGLSLC